MCPTSLRSTSLYHFIFSTSNLKKNHIYSPFLSAYCNCMYTINLGIPNSWPLVNGGRWSQVSLCYTDLNWDSKMVVALGRWSFIQVWLYMENRSRVPHFQRSQEKKSCFVSHIRTFDLGVNPIKFWFLHFSEFCY